MREGKCGSAINWKRALREKYVKQTGVKQGLVV
jgi:hypothetical protein